ncbi:hypothetical protein ACOME3_004661 [Neoechinorhynchus agilis]
MEYYLYYFHSFYRALYFSNTSQLANEVFKDVSINDCKIPANEVESYYRNLFENPEGTNRKPSANEDRTASWTLMTAEEVDAAMKGIKFASALGVDRVSTRQIKAFDKVIIEPVIPYNMALQIGGQPNS